MAGCRYQTSYSSDSPGIRTYQSLQASILHGMTSPELAAIRNQTSAELAAIRLHVHSDFIRACRIAGIRTQNQTSDFIRACKYQESGIRYQTLSVPFRIVTTRMVLATMLELLEEEGSLLGEVISATFGWSLFGPFQSVFGSAPEQLRKLPQNKPIKLRKPPPPTKKQRLHLLRPRTTFCLCSSEDGPNGSNDAVCTYVGA